MRKALQISWVYFVWTRTKGSSRNENFTSKVFSSESRIYGNFDFRILSGSVHIMRNQQYMLDVSTAHGNIGHEYLYNVLLCLFFQRALNGRLVGWSRRENWRMRRHDINWFQPISKQLAFSRQNNAAAAAPLLQNYNVLLGRSSNPVTIWHVKRGAR